jgi:hypothetical protein
MDYVKNILAIYRQATDSEKDAGILWYARAQTAARDIAVRLDIPVRVVVGVMAALSPNNRWERNVKDAERLIVAYLDGDDIESVKTSTYNAMRTKAWSILDAMPLDDQHIMRILNGQKIKSFFSNIMGHDTCTIDGHARNIAFAERVGLTDARTTIGKKLYAELQDAYNVAAHAAGIKPYEMQAITWVVWKRIHQI